MNDDWLFTLFDPEEAAELTAALVALRSYPGEEGPVQRFVLDWLAAQGLRPELQATEGDRPNVIARVVNGEGPTILLNGHTDTVLAVEGWEVDPWSGFRDGSRLYGLGACDMKSGVAAAMLAARALHEHRDFWQGTVIFSSVVDEEAYSLGAHTLINSGIRADYCIVTEASWQAPCLGSVGKILVRVEVIGKAAHGTMPWQGINAATEAARFVAGLDSVPVGKHPRMRGSRCVLSLASGNDQYVITVPEKAQIIVNRMTVPGESEEDVLAEMRALADSLDSPAEFAFHIEPPFYPPWETASDHPLAQALTTAYRAETSQAPTWGYWGFGDMNLFSSEAGIPTVMIGPLGGNFHQANEWVDIPSIAATSRLIVRVVGRLMGDGDG